VKGTCTFTFDDGPDPEWTPRVLAELDRCEARATFFMIGERVARAPELARTVGDAGHDVELHCDRHVRHPEYSEDELRQDTEAALRAFASAGLPRPRRWRTPWGVCTAATSKVAAEHTLELVHWTIDTHDWRGDRSAVMLEAVEELMEDRAVVLMHDALGPGARRTGVGETVRLIAPLCAAARERGLEVVPLSQAGVPR
jgi:peptidoglycan/xylan/chitin deacetylase (PgdA/CDA1 family)